MELTLYQVDAFAERLFTGNPAAVCPLEQWLPEETMQAVAAENNLSETAFFVREDRGWHIRWFTPTREVRLCGHATLASAYIYFRHIAPEASSVEFHSLSGRLVVSRDGQLLTLDFPSQPPEPAEAPHALGRALGLEPVAVFAAEDWIVLLDNEDAVRAIQPDFTLLRTLDRRGLILTAKGRECDFVSRFFAPKYGIDEDPVTGSAHTQLTPFWAGRLGRDTLHARQLSARGGELYCECKGARVRIGGRVVPYLKGTITLDYPDRISQCRIS